MKRLGAAAVLLAGCSSLEVSAIPPSTADAGAPDVGPGVDAGSGVDAGTARACPTASFLDVAPAPGAGANYPDPVLDVSCDEDFVVVHTNGVPPYRLVMVTPNPLVAEDRTRRIPRAPSVAPQPSAIPLLGEVGIAINGLPFFGPNEAAPGYGDPVHNRITDQCFGHTAFEYHYHALREVCLAQENLVSEPWTAADPPASQPSRLLGWAFDGFPIYGPRECADAACRTMVTMKSSWRRTGDPSTNAWDAYTYEAQGGADHLDRCNGHVGPGGDYHYHATDGFPYILGCYAGTPLRQGMMMMRGDAGTTADAGRPPRDGGTMPMPRMDGGMMMPPSCTDPSDCTNRCPPGAIGCTCHELPGMSTMACLPTCNEARDCPPGPMGMTLRCDPTDHVCVP